MTFTTCHTIEELDQNYEGVEGSILVHWRAGGSYHPARINAPAELCYEEEHPEYEVEGITIFAFGKLYYLSLDEILDYLEYDELLGAAQLKHEGN